MSMPRLSIIPARAATDRKLKPRDLQVLCVLGRHTDELGWCRRSQKRMAAEMDCSRSTVFEAIERLIKAGYLDRLVHETESGRDSAHSYRVILDPVHPSPDDIPMDDDGGEYVENMGTDPCRYTGTPADIPAPPAGPRPAPPAGSGPAPINDPSLTTPLELRERARTRDEDGKRCERWLKRVHPHWPTHVSDSTPEALKAALALTEMERENAAARMADYLAADKATGRKYPCAFARYLAEKRWEKLPPPAEKPFDEFASPFSKAWGAWIVAHLLGLAGEAKPGWPLVAGLYNRAKLRQGAKIARRWHELAAEFEPVPVQSATMAAWEAEFARRAWPWMPDPGDQPVIYLPPGGPNGLAAFEASVTAGEQ